MVTIKNPQISNLDTVIGINCLKILDLNFAKAHVELAKWAGQLGLEFVAKRGVPVQNSKFLG